MEDKAKTDNNIEEAINSSVRSEVRVDAELSGARRPLLITLAGHGEQISPWWSPTRDNDLRNLVRKSDHLSGALYNMSTKIAAIPMHVVPRDTSIRQHVRLAEEYTRHFRSFSEFGLGWEQFVSKWVEEYHTQDNGAFVEFIADGPPDTPISGMIYSMNILDASQCTRTSNPEYPVIYTAFDGRRYKMHYTRVSAVSQSPSPKWDMNNVGFCAISRCVVTAQNLLDISVYKQERMGSRPSQGIFVTGGGLDPDDLEAATEMARTADDMAGLSRYSNTMTVVGNKNYLDPKLTLVRLNEAPEWFDEKESTILGMAVIAMAFGIDARELFPALESGATKADAIITHIKQRGKGPGHTIAILEHMLNTKVLPSFLRAEFDFQDDSQDRQSAEISSVRSYTRVRNIQSGATNTRVERQLMTERGEISQAQFEDLELEDGRLDTGADVEVLFHSKDPQYQEWLGGCAEENYEEKLIVINQVLADSRNVDIIYKARRAAAAIKWKFVYSQEVVDDEENLVDGDGDGMIYDGTPRERPISKPNRRRGKLGPSDRESAMPDESYARDRNSRQLPKPLVNATDETQVYQDTDGMK